MARSFKHFREAFCTDDIWWGHKDDETSLARARDVLTHLRRSRILFLLGFSALTGLVLITPKYNLPWVGTVALVHLALFLAGILLLIQPLQRLILHFDLEARPLRRELSWSLPVLFLLYLLTTILTLESAERTAVWVASLVVALGLAVALHFLLSIGPSVGVLRAAAILVLLVPVARYTLVPATAKGRSPAQLPAEQEWLFPMIATNPSGARVYLDWQLQGETPLRLQSEDMEQATRMVVVKEGYRARDRTLHSSRPYFFKLHPESGSTGLAGLSNTVIVRVLGEGGGTFLPRLKTALIEHGLFPAPDDDGGFERGLARLGELDLGDFRAWIRSQAHTHVLVMIRLPGARPPFDPESLLLGGKTLPNYPARHLRVVVIDLREGELLSSFTLRGSADSPETAPLLARQLADRLDKARSGEDHD